MRKVMGGGVGNFQLARILFSLPAYAGIFLQLKPSARILFIYFSTNLILVFSL